MGKPWVCPYCNRPCTVRDDDVKVMNTKPAFISKEHGDYKACLVVIVCPNPSCRKCTISLAIRQSGGQPPGGERELYSRLLLPESEAKPFPDYIPEQLRADYQEACLIKDKSPKASATLSRRCLQGMIRDYWEIKKGHLKDAIEALKPKIGDATWRAIDAVRSVGNIGAHMEKDVNLIVDVDPEEAGLLIELIETLFEDWYIARYEKDARMKALADLAEEKKAARKAPSPAPPESKQ